MKREEMLKLMEEAKVGGGSKLHMRSESIQKKERVKRIPNLKKGLKKKAKLLLVTDLAFPFNPETGTADAEFNADNKYRPPFSATSVALMMKESANENEALKNTLMKRAGLVEWDTSDVEHVTEDDVKIFVKYRVPRVFTVPVVHINIPAMTKSDYGMDYAISVERDPMTGEVVGEEPGALKINKLFRDIAYEELQDYNDKLESGEIKHTDKQQKEFRSGVFGKIPVSDDHPANYVTAFEIPLTSKYEISSDAAIGSCSADEMKSMFVLSKYSKGISDAVTSYVSGDWEKFDKYLDYYEVDMSCPTEVDGDPDSNQGKMLIGKDTKFEKPTNPLCEDESYEAISAVLRECIDGMVDVEEQVRRSMRISPYTPVVEDQLFTALSSVLDLEQNEFVTQNVLKQNKEVITLAFGDTGLELLEEVDAGISDRADGSLDEAKAASEAKAYDLNSADFADAVPVEEIQLEDDFQLD